MTSHGSRARISVTWGLRCFGTADAMSGCTEPAPTHLIESGLDTVGRKVKQLSGHTLRKALSGRVAGDRNDRHGRVEKPAGVTQRRPLESIAVWVVAIVSSKAGSRPHCSERVGKDN